MEKIIKNNPDCTFLDLGFVNFCESCPVFYVCQGLDKKIEAYNKEKVTTLK